MGRRGLGPVKSEITLSRSRPLEQDLAVGISHHETSPTIGALAQLDGDASVLLEQSERRACRRAAPQPAEGPVGVEQAEFLCLHLEGMNLFRAFGASAPHAHSGHHQGGESHEPEYAHLASEGRDFVLRCHWIYPLVGVQISRSIVFTVVPRRW